ncbi:MAG: NifB/NifX family molybdenum-iron cluster-binding protein [Promethearchaeia archaeon]
MTKIAIPSFGQGGLNVQVNPRFGRTKSFTIVTVEKDKIESVKAVPNSAANAMGGAGIQAAQIVGNNGADVIIVGNVGPNAAQSLSALNLKIYQTPSRQITVKEAVQLYIDGDLNEISNANVGAHYGMGGGGGGRGMGGGGGGGGRGMGGGSRRNL